MVDEISVHSFLFDGAKATPNGELHPIERYVGSIADPDYVEGAIELKVWDTCVLDRGMWDLVDRLWADVLSALVKLRTTDTSVVHFPDQPLEVHFTRDTRRDAVQIVVDPAGSDRCSVRCSFRELERALVLGATVFADEVDRIHIAAGRKKPQAIFVIRQLLVDLEQHAG